MLSDRQKLILKAIIEEYVSTNEPVGSKSLTSKPYLDFSSATIRYDMQQLEEDGYLEKTHTSSGRIPSEVGYRYYVDNLIIRDDEVINYYRYIDEKGVVHLFKLKENSFTEYYEATNGNLCLTLNKDYTFTVIDDKEIKTFDRKGFLIEIKRKHGLIKISYDLNNRIERITDNRGNKVEVIYKDNQIVFKNQFNKTLKILDSEKMLTVFDEDETKYMFNKSRRLSTIVSKNTIFGFEYDQIGRLLNTFKEIL